LTQKCTGAQYTGVCVTEVDRQIIDEVYKEKKVELWDKRRFYPNIFVYLRPNDGQGNGAITIARDKKGEKYLELLPSKGLSAFGITPKNKEQIMAMSALLDPTIPLSIMTGRAGTGKTLLAIAAALQTVEDGVYDRILITRPMSQVGKYNLGALPGDIDEKFGPYLENYLTNIQQLVGDDKTTIDVLINKMNITAMPLQLIRGASWTKTFIIADEVQVLDHDEMLTLGTRIGEGSKLVILGDLRQRDEKIARTKTGLYKLMNDMRAKQSSLISAIELLKCERSELAALIADIFEDD